MKAFIDSNIPMYVAGSEHPNRQPARRFLARVQKGEIEGCSSTEVLQEILHRYCSLRRRDLAVEVYDQFLQICPEVFHVTLADTDRARDLVAQLPALMPRNALHAAVMLNQEVEWIATFDSGFDQIPGLRRLELR